MIAYLLIGLCVVLATTHHAKEEKKFTPTFSEKMLVFICWPYILTIIFLQILDNK